MGTEELVLKEVTDPYSCLVDLNLFSDLVDLFMYLPNKEKVFDQQISPEIHGVLSSNLQKKASAVKSKETPDQINLRRTMEFIWIRIQERFYTISPAFRFFDKNQDGQISFEEWVIALETLKVKLSSKDLNVVYKHLDEGMKGHLDYNDFCNLSDERRMKIDPATAMLKEYKETGKVLVHTGKNATRSPSRKEKNRRSSAVSAMQAHSSTEKTDLKQYLS